jgi:two-component system chemotaxis response regulator CheB
LFRETLAKEISKDFGIEVIGTAENPFAARDKILELRPDVVTLDVEMPKMDGIAFLKKLMPQYPLPVIVVSVVSEAVFDAMNAGAVDFVTKPDFQSAHGVPGFINDLAAKIKIAANSKVTIQKTSDFHSLITTEAKINSDKIIVIGASTGGTEAIFSILKCLPPTMPGILIVQHIPPVFSRMFAERMNNQTALKVKEAKQGDYVEKGTVLIAPGGRHMKMKKAGARFKVDVFEGDKVNGHCPSVDVLFESAAKEAGSKTIGIILTGMGYDGAKGLLAIRRKGGRTIGQNELSSVVYGMPKAAFNIGAVEKQTALQNIPQLLLTMLK